MTTPNTDRLHSGDPCIHCGTPHDDVPVGPCRGERKNGPDAMCECGHKKLYHLKNTECAKVVGRTSSHRAKFCPCKSFTPTKPKPRRIK